MVKIAPSILAADFSQLGEEIEKINKTSADIIHIDIMDGHFVPTLSFGPMIVSDIRKYSDLPFDCHLMVTNPEDYIEGLVKSGADMISFHAEACIHQHRVLTHIKEAGLKAGIVLNPGSSVYLIESILSEVDYVLQMTVNPGFGGQGFIDNTLKNIEQLDILRKTYGYHYEIEVDGGIDLLTAQECVNRGADILVAGSTFFNSSNPPELVESLKHIKSTPPIEGIEL